MPPLAPRIRFFVAFALACSVALPLTAAPCAALTIKSVKVTIDPVQGDSFAIKGELGALDPPGIDFAGASQIVLELDGFVAGVGATDVKRSKTSLSFKGPSKTPGLSQLKIDLKKRRFAAKGSGLLLPSLPATFMVRLRADTDAACALLPLERLGKPPKKPPTKPKAVKYGLPKKNVGFPCGLEGRVRADPPAVEIDVPTPVRFTAKVAPGIVLGVDGVQLRRIEGGAVQPTPVCTLVDDGSEASGDLVAGDRLFACTATLDEGALGSVQLVAQVDAGTTIVGSAVLVVPVVPVLTDDAVGASFDAQTAARLLWDDIETQLGDSLNARLAAVRQIAALPDVADVGLGANGSDIVIRFTSGLRGGILLDTRFGDVPTPLQRVAEDGARAANAVTSGATDAQPRSAGTCPVTPERVLMGTRKAIVLKTSYFGSFDDWPLAEAGFEGSCLPIDVSVQALTRATLLGMFTTSPSAVFLSTHGFVDRDASIAIVTDETATRDDAIFFDLDQQIHPGRRYQAEVVGLPKTMVAGNRNVWIVRPSYLRRGAGTMSKGFVYASHCHSTEDAEERALFTSKGAVAYFGYDGTTSNRFALAVTSTVIRDVAQHMLTTGDAYDRATHDDPDPQNHDPLAKGIRRVDRPPATFHLLGEHQLAYVGKPTVSPASSSIQQGQSVVLTPAVDDKGDCELRHSWTNTVRAGALSDGAGGSGAVFDTIEPTVTYDSDDDDAGSDDITVSVRTDAPDAPFFGTACASVDVLGCGDGKKNGSEECDGDDDAGCPGTCRSDCTCRVDPKCGDDEKNPGEVCDGTDREVCDALASPRSGYCHPDCHGCAQCGDGVLDPNEECELDDDSPCPGACRGDCTCGCAPGDPNGCAPDACCHPQLKICCTPERIASDPECFATASGCCGNAGTLPPNFCGGSGGPSVCPDEECNDTTLYWCFVCDNKFMDGFCDFGAGGGCTGP
jgi:hypothetical protein